MTTQTPNAMPYEQSSKGVGYDALQVSSLVGKTLPENKTTSLEQTLAALTFSESFNEQYRNALLEGDVKAAGDALKDFYLSTQVAQVAAEHPLTEKTRQEMSELDASNQRAFILEHLEQLRELFNENGARFGELWELFKPTRLDVREINKSAKLKKLVPELITVAGTLNMIQTLAVRYGNAVQKHNQLAHHFLTGCAFPAVYSEEVTSVVPFQRYTPFRDEGVREQEALNPALPFACMLEKEAQAGREVVLQWCTDEQLAQQEAEYERMIQELGAYVRDKFHNQSVVTLKGREIEVYKYWVTRQ